MAKATPVPSPEQIESIQHEAFIGLFLTNRLYQETPNFARVLGYEVVPTGRAIFSEYIPGTRWSVFVRECEYADFRAVLAQVLLALYIGFRRFHLVHADLHSGNILVAAETMTVTLAPDLQIVSRYRAVIIDFENAMAEVNGELISPANFRPRDWDTSWLLDFDTLFDETKSSLVLGGKQKEEKMGLFQQTVPLLEQAQTATEFYLAFVDLLRRM